MSVRTYSPKDVQVIVGGNIISGFADGSFVVVEREVDAFTKHVGSDGEVGRVKSANKSGTCTITLAQYSPSNDVLSALANLDELTGNGVVPVIVKDSKGTTLMFSGDGWVKKQPAVEFSNEVTDREWMLDMASISYFVGGNS